MKRAWFLTTAACVVLILGIILAFGPGVPPAAGATESRPGVRANAAACSVSGSVSADTTWSPAGCDPYIVSGSVVVPTGVTLTIAPGTTVKFDSLKGLLVQGTLVARGTAGNPITFTSNQGTPAKGDWNSIHFTDSSTDATFDGSGSYVGGSIIQYAVIEYAGSPGATGTLYIEASSPYIDHNTIRNNGAKGINAAGNGALRVNNNTITGNTTSYSDGGGGGIYVNQGAVTINNNTITGNTALASGNAGGIFAIGTVTITNNTITGNTASGICGGIFASGTGTITNNTITSNTASNSGGGICASFTGTITNNTITSNTASNSGG
ncbi:MAG: right-handed parallel beta-helix repeat-containing protein, partial [Dehalococcoidia bacterium]|nr:right-handed parallel beta-helix repeat-containing protein [Dehalococcoidia bacterium]